MLRGYGLILTQNWIENFGSSFRHLNCAAQEQIILPRLVKLPLIKQELVAEAKGSLGGLSGWDMDVIEKEFFRLLLETVELLSVSSLKGRFPFLSLRSRVLNLK